MKNIKKDEQENQIINPQLKSIQEILDEKEYIVPRYQREYAWDNENITKFINSIIEGSENNKNIYIGNMIFEKNGDECRIIDGQQRITTIILILYYLTGDKCYGNKLNIKSENQKEKFKQIFKEDICEIISNIKKELEVDDDSEDDEYINNRAKNKKRKNIIEELKTNNIYKISLYYIEQNMNGYKKSEKNEELVKFILNNLKLVTVELISKINGNNTDIDIAKVFDAINTTGKPLSPKDVFKIRIYNLKNESEEVIETINRVYQNIDKLNNEKILGKEKEIKKSLKLTKHQTPAMWSEKTSVDELLKIYQAYLVANKGNIKYNADLLKMSFGNFYDKLFDYMQNGNIAKIEEKKWFETFEKKDGTLNLEDIMDIEEAIENFKSYIVERKWKRPEAFFWYQLFRNYTGYYGRYSYLLILYFKENKEKGFEEFIIELSKICVIYSIIRDKTVDALKTKLNYLSMKMLKNDVKIKNELMKLYIKEDSKSLENKSLKELEKMKNKSIQDLKDELENKLKEKIIGSKIGSRNRGRCICFILAYDAEKDKIKDEELKDKKLKEKIELLFSVQLDIEHIYAINRNQQNEDLENSKENGIGNIMILESSINKTIKDRSVYEKVMSKKNNKDEIGYKESSFQIVHNIVEEYQKYSEEDLEKNYISDIKDNKKNNKIQKNIEIIIKYLFEED